jgi:hypothetical protein
VRVAMSEMEGRQASGSTCSTKALPLSGARFEEGRNALFCERIDCVSAFASAMTLGSRLLLTKSSRKCCSTDRDATPVPANENCSDHHTNRPLVARAHKKHLKVDAAAQDGSCMLLEGKQRTPVMLESPPLPASTDAAS